MHTPLSIIIKRFNALSALANEEDDYSQNLIVGPGQSFEYGKPDTIELTAEPEPCAKALEAFLEALPYEVVSALVSLMYSGRDREPDAADYWKTLREQFHAKSRAIEAIMEKSPRAEYIEQGIQLLPGGVGLNELPNKILSS